MRIIWLLADTVTLKKICFPLLKLVLWVLAFVCSSAEASVMHRKTAGFKISRPDLRIRIFLKQVISLECILGSEIPSNPRVTTVLV